MSTTFTAGVVALGRHDPKAMKRKRPDLCAEHGHPGVTYNPHMDKTWCLCGEVVRDGDHFTHAACCGGPLEEEALAVPDDDPAHMEKLDATIRYERGGTARFEVTITEVTG